MRYFTTFLFGFLVTVAVIAQDSCSVYVSDALATLDTVCKETSRNELCYGNNLVSISTTTGESLDFSQPGDTVSIFDLAAIRSSPFAAPDEWGIALMKIQANIPDSLPGQNVTFLLFGDVNLANADSDVAMQAVYFSSGIGESICEDVPQDGILIQSPDYEEPIELIINDVEISLGSTIYLQAEPDHAMWVYVLEGFAFVRVEDVTINVPEGAFVWIPIDGELHAIGSPVEATAYDPQNVVSVPVTNLEEDIEIAEPATEEDIMAANHAVVGNWHGTQADGSIIQMTITSSGGTSYHATGSDSQSHPESPCEGESYSFDEEFTLANNILTGSYEVVCQNGTRLPGEEEAIYDSNTDTLAFPASHLVLDRQ